MDAGLNFESGNEDKILFSLLYDKYSGAVMGFIIRNTNTLPDAEAILIEVLLQVWNEIKTFYTEENKLMRILIMALSCLCA